MGILIHMEEDEVYAITSCLDMIECMNEDTGYNLPAGEMPPVPVIAAVAGAENNVLEVDAGNVDHIYVVIPAEESTARIISFMYMPFVSC